MLLVECRQCNRSATVDCAEAHDGGARYCADADCAHRDPDAAFDRARPDCNCCPVDHHHGQAANACPEVHDPCSDEGCSFAALADDGNCPGHHGLGVPGCTVCRPLLITAMAGHVTMRPVTGG